MKIILMILLISLVFYSCGDDPIYQKEVYSNKLKEINLKEDKLDKRMAELDELTRKNKKNWELSSVLTASIDIKAGSKISSKMLKTSSFPKMSISSNMISPSSKEFFIGQTITRDIKMGDVIFHNDILAEKSITGVSAVLQNKARAVNLSFTKENPVSQLIRPHNHIDLVWTYKDNKTNKLMSKLLFQDIIVIAVWRYTAENIRIELKKQDDNIKFNSISLYLTAKEALVLDLAKKSGSLSAIIRNSDSIDKVEENEISLAEIIKDNKLINKLNKNRKESSQKVSIIKAQ